jgi:ATP-dependent Clp protease protease subunit
MPHVSRWLSTSILLLLSPIRVAAQEPSAVVPQIRPQTAVLRFFSQVDQNTVAQLLMQVDAQLKMGTKSFVILISSGGGDVLSGFTAYNYLKGIPADVTTFNVGNVDSAATVIYCAGKKRFSVPDARFLFHGVSLTLAGTVTLDSSSLEAQLGQLKNQNQMIERVVASTVHKSDHDTEQLISTQTILTPVQAKELGLVHEIKSNLFETGQQLVDLPIPATILPASLTKAPQVTGPVGTPIVKFEPVPGIISNLPPDAWKLSSSVSIQ